MYAFSLVFDNKVCNHPPFIGFCSFLRNIEDGCSERMLLYTFRLEILNQQKYRNDPLMIG